MMINTICNHIKEKYKISAAANEQMIIFVKNHVYYIHFNSLLEDLVPGLVVDINDPELLPKIYNYIENAG